MAMQRMMMQQGRQGKKGKQKEAAKPAEPVLVSVQFTAEWKLDAKTPEDLLIAVHALQEKIKGADLAGMKDAEKLSPEQEEMLEEMESQSFGRFSNNEGPKPGEQPRQPKPAPGDATWTRKITPDPVLLFRFSALTFNGHRIHLRVLESSRALSATLFRDGERASPESGGGRARAGGSAGCVAPDARCRRGAAVRRAGVLVLAQNGHDWLSRSESRESSVGRRASVKSLHCRPRHGTPRNEPSHA